MVSRERVVPRAIDAGPFLGPLSFAAHGENDDDKLVLVVTPGGGWAVGRGGTAKTPPGHNENNLQESWDCGIQDPLFSLSSGPKKTLEIQLLALKMCCFCVEP